MEKVLLIGAGGHSTVILDALKLTTHFQSAAFVNSKEDTPQKEYLGLPVLPEEQLTYLLHPKGIICVGDNSLRQVISQKVLEFNTNFEFINVIHPSAIVSPSAVLGMGNFIGAGTVVGPNCHIENHCILNTVSSIDHDSHMSSFSSLGPGVICGGNVRIGEATAIGLGAKIIHNIKIGAHTIIGAGSTVLDPVGDYLVAYGTPCSEKRTRNKDEKYL